MGNLLGGGRGIVLRLLSDSGGPGAVNQCRREAKALRGEDLRVFIAKCVTAYA